MILVEDYIGMTVLAFDSTLCNEWLAKNGDKSGALGKKVFDIFVKESGRP